MSAVGWVSIVGVKPPLIEFRYLYLTKTCGARSSHYNTKEVIIEAVTSVSDHIRTPPSKDHLSARNGKWGDAHSVFLIGIHAKFKIQGSTTSLQTYIK